jgi:uncharacterized protein (DUF983 family)
MPVNIMLTGLFSPCCLVFLKAQLYPSEELIVSRCSACGREVHKSEALDMLTRDAIISNLYQQDENLS